MKKILLTWPGIIFSILLYFVGAFIESSFNIEKWNYQVRVIIGIFIAMIILISMILQLILNFDEKADRKNKKNADE